MDGYTRDHSKNFQNIERPPLAVSRQFGMKGQYGSMWDMTRSFVAFTLLHCNVLNQKSQDNFLYLQRALSFNLRTNNGDI